MTTHTASAAPTVAGPAFDVDPAAAVAQIRHNCQHNGFALFTVGEDTLTGDVILTEVASRLELGTPFVPGLYASDPGRFGYDEAGFNTISPKLAAGEHRFFGTGAAQGFHTDGTVEDIGCVGTSLLWFERAADHGGHTTVFRAVAAFEQLRRLDPAGAAALQAGDALTRVATAFVPPVRATGPAFADLGAGLRTRWADDGSEIWQLAGPLGGPRAAAVEQLRRMSQPGSPYRCDVAIGSRTGLVLCNSVVAHGRTEFVAAPGERVLIRGLYTREVGH